MTAPLSADRIKELREWLTSLTSGSDDDIRADLLSILDDHSSLRAENELLLLMFGNTENARFELRIKLDKAEAEVKRLNTWHTTISEVWKARAEKAEAELKVAEGTIEEITKAWCLDAAQLEKQRPLVEAIMKAGVLESIQAEIDYQEIDDAPDEVTDIFRAAHALREEKK